MALLPTVASAAESRGTPGMTLNWLHQFPDLVDLAVAFIVLAAAVPRRGDDQLISGPHEGSLA